RLEGFGVRGDVSRVHGGNEDADIGNSGCITAIAADHADDFCTNRLGELESGDQIGADVLFHAAAAHREDQNQIVGAQAAGAQPAIENRTPPFVVDASGKLRQ